MVLCGSLMFKEWAKVLKEEVCLPVSLIEERSHKFKAVFLGIYKANVMCTSSPELIGVL